MYPKCGEGDRPVFVLPDVLERSLENIVKLLDVEDRKRYTFYTLPESSLKEKDITLLLEECKALIKSQNIGALYFTRRNSYLLAGILAEACPSLASLTFEAAFLCAHKYYTSSLVDSSEHKLPYRIEDLDQDIYDTAYRVLRNFKAPGVIRSCLGSGNAVYCFHNRDELMKIILKCRQDARIISKEVFPLLEDRVDLQTYPHAMDHCVVIHPYFDSFSLSGDVTWKNVSAEACVWRGEVVPWAVVDSITLPYGAPDATQFFSGFEMPTRLSEHQQGALWAAFRRDVTRLVEAGLTAGFVHAEYMVFQRPADLVHLVSMTPTVHSKCANMYRFGLENGNNVAASLALQFGDKPVQPKATGQYVLNYTMAVMDSVNASDVVHYDKVKDYADEVSLRFGPDDVITLDMARDYTLFGFITVAGPGFPHCLERVKTIRAAVLKHPELVPLAC